MKRLIFAGGLSLALACGAFAGPLTGYTNSGIFTTSSPLVIDATNFVNLGVFDLSIPASFGQFGFSDVLTYTNRNVMFCNEGFLFNNSPATVGNIGPSVNFVNQNPGQIYGGAAFPQSGSIPLTGGGTFPQIIISATNITSSGILQVGQTGRIAATGDALNLSHGAAIIEGLDLGAGAVTGGAVLGPAEFIQYWGIGLNSNNFLVFNLSLTNVNMPPTTAPSTITNSPANGLASAGTVQSNFPFSVPNASAIAITNVVSPSNIITQVIIVGDSLGIVTPYPFFVPINTQISTNAIQEGVVQWGVQLTNVTGDVVSNTLFLTDDIGALTQQATEVTNSFSPGGQPLLVPTNFTLLPTFRGTVPPNYTGNVVPYSTSIFSNGFGTNGNGLGLITNEYATFAVNLAPVTVQPDPTVAGSTFSNVPARIEITANWSLDLTGAIINAGNYLNLSSPNDFRGSQGALITFPFADINLGSSNGQMSISNLVSPYLTRWNGSIQAWSAIWTNVTASVTNAVITNSFPITNVFTVLMVSSALSPTSPVNIENLSLRSTNVVVSDVLNVNASLLINAQSLTITSNAPGALTPNGELIYFPSDQSDLFSANLPSMQFFTNSGVFESLNAAFFQVRQDPNNPSAGDGPWQSVVNAGTIFSGGGDIFWANNFQNTGFVIADFGPISVTSTTAVITNGQMNASTGDMSFSSGSLTINNEILTASGLFNLGASTLLTDLIGSGTNKLVPPVNTFTAGDGFSLVTAPASPSGLLGTSITSLCRTNAQCENFWAGLPVALSGALPPTNALPIMANNVPLGQLVLDGGNNKSVYHFEGANYDTVTPYAMYVDQISLLDGATNLSPGTTNGFTAFKIDPNVTIYFLDAVAGPTNKDISVTLNGAAGGHLVWVSNYVGHFSVLEVAYTNVAFPNIYNPQSQTFGVNRGYVAAYGLPPVPLTPQTIALVIGATNVNSTPKASISWYAPAYSTNTLYFRTLSNTNWLVRTNFVQGASSGRVSFLDSLATNHLYKVGVAPSQ